MSLNGGFGSAPSQPTAGGDKYSHLTDLFSSSPPKSETQPQGSSTGWGMSSNTGSGSVNWNSSAPSSTGVNWGGESNSSSTGVNWNSSSGVASTASSTGVGWGGASTANTGMSWNTASTAQTNGKYLSYYCLFKKYICSYESKNMKYKASREHKTVHFVDDIYFVLRNIRF